MLSEITWKEYLEWSAYYQLEPFGEDRADLRAASIVTPLMNAWRGKGKRAYKFSDFVLKFGKKKKQTTWQNMRSMAKAIASAYTDKE